MARPHANTHTGELQLNQPEVQVRAYGQLCSVDVSNHQLSVSQLMRSVQTQLGVHGQSLAFRDVDGRNLTTDDDLKLALEQTRIPLQASFSPELSKDFADTAIHSMEMKRDELAQMQWLLVREQFGAVASQASSYAAQLKDLKEELAKQKRSQDLLVETLRKEIESQVEQESNGRRSATQLINNRIDAVMQALHHETGAREILQLQQQKQMESAWDVLDAEKQQRAAEFAQLRNELEVFRQERETENKLQGQANTRMSNDVEAISQRCDEFYKELRQEAEDRLAQYGQVMHEASETASAHQKKLLHTQSSLQAHKTDAGNRVDRLEQLFNQNNDTFLKSLEEKKQAIMKINERVDANSREIHTERNERKAVFNVAKSADEKANSLVEQLERQELQSQDWREHERTVREDQLRTLQNNLSMQCAQVQALDKLITHRIAQEQGPAQMSSILKSGSASHSQELAVMQETPSESAAPYRSGREVRDVPRAPSRDAPSETSTPRIQASNHALSPYAAHEEPEAADPRAATGNAGPGKGGQPSPRMPSRQQSAPMVQPGQPFTIQPGVLGQHLVTPRSSSPSQDRSQLYPGALGGGFRPFGQQPRVGLLRR